MLHWTDLVFRVASTTPLLVFGCFPRLRLRIGRSYTTSISSTLT